MRIIPVFLPEAQCPYSCAYCDVSVAATGGDRCHTPDEAVARVRAALATLDRHHPSDPVQIAFYGGTFTWGGPERMDPWLDAVQSFRTHPRVTGLRVSTRPDRLDAVILDRLADAGVTDIELGVQSFDDAVLTAVGRGHTAARAKEAIVGCRTAGFTVGIHLMTGFPFESDDAWRRTVRETIQICPDTVRLHPLLVLEDTRFHQAGVRPLSDDRVLDRLAAAVLAFRRADIPVIRLGMQLESGREARVVAGLYHPALRHRVMSRLYSRLMACHGMVEGVCGVHPAHLSYAVGFQRENANTRPGLVFSPCPDAEPWGLVWREKWYDMATLRWEGERA